MSVKLIVVLTCLTLLSGCLVTNQAQKAQSAVEDYFDDEVIINDMEVPLAMMTEVTIGRPGDIGNAGFLSYSVLGIDFEADLLILDMEVQNNSKSTMEFRPESHMAMYDNAEMAGFPYEPVNLRISENKLYGVIQPGNRIRGRVAFDKPKMEDNRAYLFVGGNDEAAYVYEINRGYDNYQSMAAFENGEIISGLSIGSLIESDQFSISLEDVAYSLDEREIPIASCIIKVRNASDEQKVFLVGYNVVSVHDLAGNALSIDAKDVTIPKVIESGEEVSGIVQVSLSEEGQGFYMTFRPDEGDFDHLSVVVVK